MDTVIEKQPGIIRASGQYGVDKRIVDLCTFDVTRNPWRCGGFFDAIITDPPCKCDNDVLRHAHLVMANFYRWCPSGSQTTWTQEGADCVHKTSRADSPSPVNPLISPPYHSSHLDWCRDDQPYVPPTKPYELSALATDLVLLARYLLKPKGRLVFFLPTVTDEYQAIDVQNMLCEGMEVIANSLQDFGAWGRRVRLYSLSYDALRDS